MKDNVIKVDFSKNSNKKNGRSLFFSLKLFLSKLINSKNRTPEASKINTAKDNKKIIYYSRDIS
ncbi:hypothetical protein [Clostridium luticellarii]|jgi:hypothetical protein|uniref:Uncharacterized protein n=1 Tax=Clostridium luticellarii TaxID=1691940 RepID=A0A2T0B2G8_9CLOT|nr:hypothetical protein [Clostridium luticellarii]MCI1944904.1 hypothetical protein [Clostridium luticellarii]MCI1968420.1 hypothetical protein [Clostridium luticellarii]MCI1995418.1 hypothetical protein [Clostridium luticellarii]MCI2039481.1 hypothetical protein [Clostridium luticellarii]PRR78101.1 hypothetical protein CLLU_36800 [Clostridium luticellarii]